jgi:hypothetical protein
MSNYLHAIAMRLKEAALELERRAGTAKGGQESLWAKHLHEDAKSILLLAEAYEGGPDSEPRPER